MWKKRPSVYVISRKGEKMPGSHFHPVLTASEDGRRLTTSGPLEHPDADVHSLRVFAVVTQEPRQGKPDDNDDPVAATCRGEVHLTRDEWEAAAAAGAPRWSFDAQAVGGLQFKKGWARGSAILLEAKANGDIETYSWSAWVWVERP